MFVYVFACLLLLHGFFHIPGFAGSVGYRKSFKKNIGSIAGWWWLIVCLLFIAAGGLLLIGNDGWSVFAVLAVMLSQMLIVQSWKQAKYGTLVNLIVLLVAVPAVATYQFTRKTKAETRTILARVIVSPLVLYLARIIYCVL